MVLNRRIGERVFVGAMELTWEPVLDRGPIGSGRVQRALLMDLSVTGAGLFAPADPEVAVDDIVIIGSNDARAVVGVRRVNPTDDAELRHYGVEFVSMEPAFERELYELIGRSRPNHPIPDTINIALEAARRPPFDDSVSEPKRRVPFAGYSPGVAGQTGEAL